MCISPPSIIFAWLDCRLQVGLCGNIVSRLQCSAVLDTGDTAGDISEDNMREGCWKRSLCCHDHVVLKNKGTTNPEIPNLEKNKCNGTSYKSYWYWRRSQERRSQERRSGQWLTFKWQQEVWFCSPRFRKSNINQKYRW